jgi:acyl-CoA reductase-like NAD-dependent aldehyde dehydrogenase
MMDLTIGGRAVATAEWFDVVDPATGELVGTAPSATVADLDRAMDAAADAQHGWAAAPEDERRAALHRLADVLDAATTELAALITAEQGKPIGWSVREVQSSLQWLRYFADLRPDLEVVQDDDVAYAVVQRRPLGVVAAITPWNFPLGLALWKLAPALVTGNTVVLKPSPYTPLTALRLGELTRDVLPPGVCNVVTGGNDLGRAMTSHPIPRKVSMTGSIAAGKQIAASAGADLKRVTLELGGNDAAIVLADADVATTAAGIAAIGFFNAGQACTAVKRVYVHERIFDELVDALAAAAAAHVVGPGTREGVTMGPLTTADQYERVVGMVGEATANGAVAAAGGRPVDGPGWFVEPTVLVGVKDDMRIVADEQFGPVLPVLPFSTEDDAIRRANDSTYGLGGSVWSSDVAHATDLAGRLECGIAWVNAHSRQAPNLPFGGVKWSGVGVENGVLGLHQFTDAHVVHAPPRPGAGAA